MIISPSVVFQMWPVQVVAWVFFLKVKFRVSTRRSLLALTSSGLDERVAVGFPEMT